MKKHSLIICWNLLATMALILLLLLTCNMLVVYNAKGKTYNNVDDIPTSEMGLLLGTTPQTRFGGRKNMFFKYRIDATEKLYKASKIKYILISGDENSLDGIDEPKCMKDALIARGIPEENIYVDGQGYRTINSIIRANNQYKGYVFTIISQEFHNERALYLAEHLDLDLKDLKAFNAQSPHSKIALFTYVREYFARVKMFWDIFASEFPKNMETCEPLSMMNLDRSDISDSF